MLDVLATAGPAEDRAHKMQLFGQFVGSWDFEWIGHDPENDDIRTANGEWHFGWVLQGRAVQDVWISPALAGRRPGTFVGEYGSTLRAYDPSTDAWNVAWVGPINGILRTFLARQREDEIVMECTNQRDGVMRWVFDQITPTSFHWRSERADSGDCPWQLREEMRVTRRR